jgi:arylsulfatase A-like enzyme
MKQTPLSNRRSFLKGSAAAALALGSRPLLGDPAISSPKSGIDPAGTNAKRPNIVMIVADQFRADFVGCYGENPDAETPNLNAMAARGTAFRSAFTNQPLCSPSRACMMTGRYATETGVWRLTLPLDQRLPTLASVLRENGYTANFIGKWHLAAIDRKKKEGFGFVPPQARGGFLDHWEGANSIEMTSTPYSGSIWNGEGKEIQFHDQYRVDFLTDRAVDFLRKPQDKPFLLYLSQLEPHQQDSTEQFVAPNGYAERYANAFVPPDLLHLPGSWESDLPGYYGSVQRIDECVGRILKTLDEQGLRENTIVCFLSDHGCNFGTRRNDLKRTPQDSSIRIPFIFQGPGFDNALQLRQVVSMIDLTPTLLDAAGITAPSSMKGKSLLPLVHSAEARQAWKNLAYIQISESMVARAIRTDEWLYSVADPTGRGNQGATSNHYQEYLMYNLFSDPAELVNLFGRRKTKATASALQATLLNCMKETGEPEAEITPLLLYP